MNYFGKILKRMLYKLGVEINTCSGREKLEYKNEIARLRNVGKKTFVTIIDIGANIGQFASHARVAFPNAQILSFEPIEDCFQQLKAGFSNDPNFKAFNCAIGKSSRKSTFHYNDYAPSSSILEISTTHISHFPKTAHSTTTTIEERMFEEVVDIGSIAAPCLIKIDVQGYELEVIKNNGAMLKAADAVIIETSFKQLYKGQPLFDEVYNEMTKLGFVYGGSYDQLYAPGTYQIIQSDSIFYQQS